MPPHSSFDYERMIPSWDENILCPTENAWGGIAGMAAIAAGVASKALPFDETCVCKMNNRKQQTDIQRTRNNKRCKSRNNRVRFSSHAEVYEIPHVNDLSEREISDLYFSYEELDRISSCVWEMVGLLDAGVEFLRTKEFDQEFTLRGVADLQEEAVQRRKNVRQTASSAVFQIQKEYNINKNKANNEKNPYEFNRSNHQNASSSRQPLVGGLYYCYSKMTSASKSSFPQNSKELADEIAIGYEQRAAAARKEAYLVAIQDEHDAYPIQYNGYH